MKIIEIFYSSENVFVCGDGDGNCDAAQEKPRKKRTLSCFFKLQVESEQNRECECKREGQKSGRVREKERRGPAEFE